MQQIPMAWIAFALVAHLFWAITNIGDKFVIGNRIQNPYIYTILFKFLALPAILVIPFIDFFVPSAGQMMLIAIASLCFFIGGFPYIKAVQVEEISRINVWWGLNPIFALLIEIFILREVFTFGEMAGFAILMISTVLASIHFSDKSFKLSKAVWLMVLATFIFSIYGILAGELVQMLPFAIVFVWVTIWMAIWSVVALIIPSVRRLYRKEVKALRSKDYGFITFLAVIAAIGIAFNQWAFSLAPVSLVLSLEGSQAIMVFVMMAVISKYAPHRMKEETDKKNVLVKVLAVVVMAVGVAVLKLS